MRFNPFSKTIRDAYQGGHEPEARHVLARAYWTFLLSLFMLTTIGAVAYGAWEFTRPFEENASEVTVGAPKTLLNRSDIQGVLDGFDARAAQFEERREAPALARDPS